MARLDKATPVAHPVLQAQLRYLRAWQSRTTGHNLDDKQIGWFTKPLREVESEMRPVRKRLNKQIRELQRDHPNRDETYRQKMTDVDQDGARTVVANGLRVFPIYQTWAVQPTTSTPPRV